MNDRKEEQTVPVYLLTGFLGSGKTTLLARVIAYCEENGKKAAVIMNELGEVNLDGQMLGDGVPMAEMLGGCICCTIRADLGMQIYNLIQEHRPDIIFIESTGAAFPVEILDGITEAALYARVELVSVITVVDGPEMLKRSRDSKGKTYKLMKEQIRCATSLLLNKADKLEPDELVEAQQLLREWNGFASITPTVRCELKDWSWLDASDDHKAIAGNRQKAPHSRESDDQDHLSGGVHKHEQACDHEHEHTHACCHSHEGHADDGETHGTHAMHEHVMVLTRYLSGPVDSEAFEALLQGLPDNVYRAKGIVSFTDTASRFLFQYAYRETDYLRITPQGNVSDVAVFIGEHFDKNRLIEQLSALESKAERH